jgi:hypothetical protein
MEAESLQPVWDPGAPRAHGPEKIESCRGRATTVLRNESKLYQTDSSLLGYYCAALLLPE